MHQFSCNLFYNKNARMHTIQYCIYHIFLVQQYSVGVVPLRIEVFNFLSGPPVQKLLLKWLLGTVVNFCPTLDPADDLQQNLNLRITTFWR